MKIKSIELNGFKRFSKTKIIDIPENSKLIILIGPNGSGKTSLFEAFKQFGSRHGGIRHNSDNLYLSKFGERDNFNHNWSQRIKIEFHDRQPNRVEEYKKLFYIRTAYRNESDFAANGLGQLKIKKLGNTRSGSSYTGIPLETQTYDYNIRGWLLGINRNFITTPSSTNNTNVLGESFTTPPSYSAGNYFGFELGYDKNGVLGNYSHLYDGNISGTTWKSIHDERVRKYNFTYDENNRVKTADFNEYNNGSFNKNLGVNYSVSNLNYDKNGNILSMNQMGLRSVSASNSALVDQLSYTYQSGSNKLAKVEDAAAANSNSLGDFQNGTNGGDDYSYDANGNLISDANKGISSIQYNYLNLPQTITMTGKGTISYTYDAGGNKLQKQVVDNTNSTSTITQYLGGLIYQNDVLQSIPQEEGRIRINSSNTGFVFDYYLKDHLGNIRMTITDDNNAASPVIDATSYYPFGLSMKVIGKEGAGGLQNKFKYNGKENQNKEFSDGSGLDYLDYGARMYDVQIGRFSTQDRFSTKYYYFSPYQYVGLNPIKYIDVNGDSLTVINLKGADGQNPTLKQRDYYVDSKVAFQVKGFAEEAMSEFSNLSVNNIFRTFPSSEITTGNTKAKGLSRHQGGFAVDFNGVKNLSKNQLYKLNKLASKFGLAPLANQSADPPHFDTDPAKNGYKNLKQAVDENKSHYDNIQEGKATPLKFDEKKYIEFKKQTDEKTKQ